MSSLKMMISKIENSMNNWLKLYRSITSSTAWLSLTPAGRAVMIAILCGCCWEESSVVVEGELRTLLPGQWLTSIPTIQRHAGPGVSPRNVRTAIKTLKVTGFLTEEVTDGNHRIITINKWDTYQSIVKVTDEVTENPTDDRQTTDRIQEVIEVKDEKIKTKAYIEDAAQRVYDYYKQTVKAGAASDSVKNIKAMLKAGHTEQELTSYIDSYVSSPVFSDDKQYRIQANNFFGRKARYQDFTEPDQNNESEGGSDDYFLPDLTDAF